MLLVSTFIRKVQVSFCAPAGPVATLSLMSKTQYVRRPARAGEHSGFMPIVHDAACYQAPGT